MRVASGRARTASLRTRITLVASAVVAAALVIGAIGFVAVLRAALLDGVRVSVERDATELAARLDSSGANSLSEDDDERLFQLASPSGTVLATSDNLRNVALGVQVGAGPQIVRLPGHDSEYLVLAERLGQNGETIVAGRSLQNVNTTLATVVGLLAVAVPLLVLLVALITRFVVGRALSPVERMRREVDSVSGTSLDRRVADPGRNDEVGRLARTMNSMLDRLEAAQRSQRRFISDASHELRSPLASLRQYAEVARSHPDQISGSELTDAVLDEGARLERLVQGMLLLARADERALEGAGAAVDVDDLALREATRLKGSTSLTVDAVAVGPARVRGDEALLGQLVRNLADNAARHATHRVAFSLRGGRTVLLAVDDDGSGVPQAERTRIFERFVRLDEARARDSGGSGLGLAIVRDIALAHGGTVSVTDSALGGAHFEVQLPGLDDDIE